MRVKGLAELRIRVETLKSCKRDARMRVKRHADACKGAYYTRTNALATTGDIEAAITGTSLHPNLATVSQPVYFFIFFEDTYVVV